MNKQLYTGNTNRGRNLRSKKDQGYDLQFGVIETMIKTKEEIDYYYYYYFYFRRIS